MRVIALVMGALRAEDVLPAAEVPPSLVPERRPRLRALHTDCEHGPYEACLICAKCGDCYDELDAAALCVDCRDAA